MATLPPFLTDVPAADASDLAGSRVKTFALDRGIQGVAGVIQEGYAQWEGARRDGLLQRVDPRIKVFFLPLFLLLVSVKQQLAVQLTICFAIMLVALLSNVKIFHFYRRICWVGFLFGVIVPLPSLLNIFAGGDLLLPLLHLEQEYKIWIYTLPKSIGITNEGVRGMMMLTLRITNSVALSMLLLYTTSFPDIIKALRLFRLPESLVLVITLTYRYVFSFSHTVTDMYLARKSRLLGSMGVVPSQQWGGERIACLFHKSQSRCMEIFKAMLSRGFEHQPPEHRCLTLDSRNRSAGLFLLLVWLGFMFWQGGVWKTSLL